MTLSCPSSSPLNQPLNLKSKKITLKCLLCQGLPVLTVDVSAVQTCNKDRATCWLWHHLQVQLALALPQSDDVTVCFTAFFFLLISLETREKWIHCPSPTRLCTGARSEPSCQKDSLRRHLEATHWHYSSTVRVSSEKVQHDTHSIPCQKAG